MDLSSLGVYLISSPAGSTYVGMTYKSFEERWSTHKANYRKGQMTCVGLKRAFNKYGIDSMSFEVLEDMRGCSIDEVLIREREWWLIFKAMGSNIYNGEPSGSGSVRHTSESKSKISRSLGGLGDERFVEIVCKGCSKLFLGYHTRTYCSYVCARTCMGRRAGLSSNKIGSISRDELVAAVLEGGNCYDISERLHIKKSSLYKLLKKYSLTIKEVQNTRTLGT